jgi:integrase/recombinase XerD
MEREIDNFVSYLHNIKKTSTNTELSYKRDLGKLRQYLEERGITDVNSITATYG